MTTPRSMCKDDAEYLETLLNDFAAAAMQALLNTELRRDQFASVEKIALEAYKQADAMIKARE